MKINILCFSSCFLSISHVRFSAYNKFRYYGEITYENIVMVLKTVNTIVFGNIYVIIRNIKI